MDQKTTIITISDGTGETARTIVEAVAVQFEDTETQLKRFNHVRTRETVETILLKAQQEKAIVVMTLVDHELRVFLLSRAMQLGVVTVDLLYPLLETLASHLGKRPSAVPGLLRQLNTRYFNRVSAVEYTVRHDDGVAPQDLAEADIVLVGISRTSKTPLSMYLAQKGYKVANIPMVPGVSLPKELFTIDQRKIVGLIIAPERLIEIRTHRLRALGAGNEGGYSNPEKVLEELEWSRTIFQSNKRWPVLDVTGKALEENAVEIENILKSRFPA